MADWGEDWDRQNSITDIMEFFNTENTPLKPEEFKEFWMSLTDAEKNEYRKANLGPE